MEYCRKCSLTGNDEVIGHWQRFKSDIAAMPSVSVVKIELVLQKSDPDRNKGTLTWNHGLIGDDARSSINVQSLREKILTDKTGVVVVNYNLNAPNRDISYVTEILALVHELLSDDYTLNSDSIFYLAGQNRFGTYWTEMKALENREIQHSGVRPSPLSRFATPEAARHTTTGW